jgi:hypothetical protein
VLNLGLHFYGNNCPTDIASPAKEDEFSACSNIAIEALTPTGFLPANSPGLPHVLIGGILILIFGDLFGYKQTLKRRHGRCA